MYHRNKIKVSHHFFISLFYLVVEMCNRPIRALLSYRVTPFFFTHSKHAIFLLKLFILSESCLKPDQQNFYIVIDTYLNCIYNNHKVQSYIESHKWPWCWVFAPLSSSLNDTAFMLPTLSSLNRIGAALFILYWCHT